MKPINTLLAVSLLSAASINSHAAEWSVSITNLTHGSYFTPLFVTAHGSANDLFQIGQPASVALQAMAEGGDISGLVAQYNGEDADTVANPASGLLMPGSSTTAELNTDANPVHEYLSIAAMILPSNDGFVGMDAMKIPTAPGTYHYYLNGYDAGTEVNDEMVTAEGGTPGTLGMPGPDLPGIGSGGTGVTTEETNKTVHIHRNILGDTDSTGGLSDADSRINRWLNPIAHVTVTVK